AVFFCACVWQRRAYSSHPDARFIHPLDYLIGDDPDNPPEDVVPTLEDEHHCRRIVYLATFIESVRGRALSRQYGAIEYAARDP
ncbi:MAG TPA: hypothetical protein VFE79_20600, partial [Paraburkholderia sp.]|nr:hypothetical protein [Paraburkholderia sp.]